MYFLSTPLDQVKGIGETSFTRLNKRGFYRVKDLVLAVPLRYEDRSQTVTINELPQKTLCTIKATITQAKNFYKGRRSMQSAKATDETGSVKLQWFNNPHVVSNIKNGTEYFISGSYDPKYKNISQPTIERATESDGSEKETLHTNRLVPLYTTTIPLKQGTQRRILKEILDHLTISSDQELQDISLTEALKEVHFPTTPDHVILSRERLALEELLALIQESKKIKAEWQSLSSAPSATVPKNIEDCIPESIPFSLTTAQLKATSEIVTDLGSTTPMNRLLIGDVGSGKTVVVGIACNLLAEQGKHSVIAAPTKILATQHAESLQKLFPSLEVQLVTGGKKMLEAPTKPTLFVGTHAVLNRLTDIQPALVIYDEQHRFGVNQRSQTLALDYMPHIVTMSATPIPRSLMLTIFSHLDLSVIDEMPAGRKPTKTWLVPGSKREDSLAWIASEIAAEQSQAIVVCPFIDQSEHQALENVAAATDVYETITTFMHTNHPKVRTGLLHGRMKKKEQSQTIEKLYATDIDLLVTTPMVEVGLDLPKASIIVIEAAERFGLASLHQLRGRVGRAGQQGYCLLFSNSKGMSSKERLEEFSQETNGLKLAELDLKKRGSGNLFGTTQHGFSQLQFADWANVDLIATAKKVYEALDPGWKPLFTPKREDTIPLAN